MIRRLARPPRPRLKTLREMRARMTLLDGRGRPMTGPRLGDAEPPPSFDDNIDNMYEDLGDSGSIEVSKAGFSQEGGKCSRTWQINPASLSDLLSALTLILGGTQYAATGTGKLARTLPQADPLYAWLYASSVPTIEGYGTYTRSIADPDLEAPGFPYGTLWEYYRLHVESMPRPFPVLSDASISAGTTKYYAETSGGTTAQYPTWAQEQNRYCTTKFVPQNDYITQQKGRQVFNSSDTASGAGSAAMPRFRLPNVLYEVTWYYVPYRLVLSPNSYLVQWLGRINQNAMNGPDGFNFAPGELQYLAFDPGLPFTPPVQTLVPLGGEGPTVVVSTEKFVNVKMTFLFTRRPLASAPGAAPTNQNYIVGGHNLLPWQDGPKWRYQQSTVADIGYASNYCPSWLSAPLELLWTDCDSPGGIT